MTTLKTYQADELKNEEMNKESETFRVVTMKVLTMQLNSVTIMDFVAYGGAALGILLATLAFVNGKLGLSNCIFMILLSSEFFLPMRRLGSYFHVAMNGMAASDKIFKFLNEEEPKERTKEVIGGDIAFDKVSFSYDADREVLHGIDLNIPEKGFVGIVGESGSGKSTVASLIMGRYNIKEGKLTIGSEDVENIREELLMKKITYIGFGSIFFKGTVRENLLMGKSDATDQELWQVLSDCSLDGFLKTEKGLDTVLLENAGNLSGGQKQRLALARAILHDSEIYVFDEATSNIDIESEEAILFQINKMAEDKTIIMISHRLANVVDANIIYCMEDGKVVEQGTHKELLEMGGTYSNLWRTQEALENFGKEAA